MLKLKDKLENALNEGRILILGGQVLIGAGFRTAFIEGFDNLPYPTRIIQVATLWFMIIGLGILLLPAAYHFIVDRGENTRGFTNLSRRCWSGRCFRSRSVSESVLSLSEKKQ